MGCEPLGWGSSLLGVSRPLSLSAPSLPCSDPSAELQPHFHPRAGSYRCGRSAAGEGSNRACASFPGLLQPSVCHSQGHRWVAPGDRPLAPQQLWFPGLQRLAVAPLVALPLRSDLLRQPHIHLLHQSLHVLQFHACGLCSYLHDTWVSLVAWLISHPCVISHPRVDSTSISGPALASGVLIMVIWVPISRISVYLCVW